MFTIPEGYDQLRGDDRLRALLEVWLRIYYTEPSIRKYTHARASFGSQSKVGWILMEADDDSVRSERNISMPNNVTNLVIAVAISHGLNLNSTHGRMTFRFSPPAVSLDLFEGDNKPVFARFLIDHEAEQRVQQQLRSSLDEG